MESDKKYICAHCNLSTDICKYGGKSEPICYKCAGLTKDYEVAKGSGVKIHREEPKTQRNEKCPCQSGKKFKQCCLIKSI